MENHDLNIEVKVENSEACPHYAGVTVKMCIRDSSVALLAYVNELTKGPIAEANAKTLNEALKKVLPEFTNNPVSYTHLWKMKKVYM